MTADRARREQPSEYWLNELVRLYLSLPPEQRRNAHRYLRHLHRLAVLRLARAWTYVPSQDENLDGLIEACEADIHTIVIAGRASTTAWAAFESAVRRWLGLSPDWGKLGRILGHYEGTASLDGLHGLRFPHPLRGLIERSGVQTASSDGHERSRAYREREGARRWVLMTTRDGASRTEERFFDEYQDLLDAMERIAPVQAWG